MLFMAMFAVVFIVRPGFLSRRFCVLPPCGVHRKASTARRIDRKARDEPFEIAAAARGAFRRIGAANDRFEVVLAETTRVLENRHGWDFIWPCRSC
jgi:hypothetical protein